MTRFLARPIRSVCRTTLPVRSNVVSGKVLSEDFETSCSNQSRLVSPYRVPYLFK